MKYLFALDSGTTSSRATLFTLDGRKVFSSTRILGCTYPSPGHVHQDPMEIFVTAMDCINEVFVRTGIKTADIVGLGIATQRETTLLVDRLTGDPLTECIVWQSKETDELANRYSGFAKMIKEKTGLPISPYFSSSKIRFLLDKYNLQERAIEGEIMAMTIDSWLVYKLTEGESFLSDVTNASRTGLFNINTLDYDDELLKIYDIPRVILPSVLPSTAFFGECRLFKRGSIKIIGVAGDQQAALLGHGMVHSGGLKMTYGTGLFCLVNTGDRPIYSQNGLLTTIALATDTGVSYALEGSVFIGGAAVSWLKDQMEMIKTPEDSEILSRQSHDESLIVVPAFNGLGTPYWDSECLGAVFGISRGTNRNDFVKATLESIGFEAADVIKTIMVDIGMSIEELGVDGGAADNDYLMQFQSDILGIPIKRPSLVEMTSLGAAFLVGLGAKIYKGLDDIQKISIDYQIFNPLRGEDWRKKKSARYDLAVKAARSFK